MRQQVDRIVVGRGRAEVKLDNVVACDALVAAALNRSQITPVPGANHIGDIGAGVIPRLLYRLGDAGGVCRESDRLTCEPLVDMNLCVLWVVDDHERYGVKEMCLPQLCRNPEVVFPVARDQLLAPDQDPVLRLRGACGLLRVDLEPKG